MTPHRISLSGCPKCGKNLKSVKLHGSTYHVRSFTEVSAIKWLRKRVSDESKLFGEWQHQVRISYQINGVWRQYVPDFYFEGKRKTVIEVKSLDSAGLGGAFYYMSPQAVFSELKAKARYATQNGFNFVLLIMHKVVE